MPKSIKFFKYIEAVAVGMPSFVEISATLEAPSAIALTMALYIEGSLTSCLNRFKGSSNIM